MNRRNTCIKQILDKLYCDLNEEKLNFKKKELRALPNYKLEKIWQSDVLPLLEADKINEEYVSEMLNEEYECFRFD